MSGDSSGPPARVAGRPGWFPLLRASAWVLLIGVTGYLVRAEVTRSELPEGVRAYTDIVYRRTGARSERLDVYVPTAPAPPGGRPAVLAIHGGGWRGGNKDSYGRMAARLSRHGYVVVAVNYTLSRPGAPSWPANLDDVREAVRWVRRHAGAYGIDPDRIAALGASAGGHLAVLLGTDPAPDRAARVQAVVDFYGPTDLPTLVQSRPPTAEPIALLLGGALNKWPDRYEAASPLRHVSHDDPPMLIIHGSDDALVPLDQSRALASALQRAGVPNRLMVVEHARHGFDFRINDRYDLLPDILDFLVKAWNNSQFEGFGITQDRPSCDRSGDGPSPRAGPSPDALAIPVGGDWRV